MNDSFLIIIINHMSNLLDQKQEVGYKLKNAKYIKK